MTKVNEEIEETEVDHTKENLESVGQMILGGIEQVGGILTGDPMTRREGEFNAEVGSIHQESNKVLTLLDESEEDENVSDQ